MFRTYFQSYDMEAFYNLLSGFNKLFEQAFIGLFDIVSGPPDFDGFSLDISFATSLPITGCI